MLREQLGPRRLLFTDDQRIRLAAKAKTLGRRALTGIRSIVTPDAFARLASRADRPKVAMAFVRPGFDEEIPGLVRPWSITPDEDDDDDYLEP